MAQAPRVGIDEWLQGNIACPIERMAGLALGRFVGIKRQCQASPSGRPREVRSTSKTSAWVLEKLITPR